jgi:hypothetical protein
MPASGVIGALKVIIGGDTSGLSAAVAGSLAVMAKFGFDMAKAAVGVNDTIDAMDKIGKQAQKIGIPVEQLSQLRLAADLSDVSMEQLGAGVGKLSKAMISAAGDPLSEASNAFRSLGVNVKDAEGKVRPVIDVTQDIATKFAGLNDGAGKTAVSMALFGKSGAELIPMLNSGGAGLQEMMKRAQALGITFDGETSKAAEKFRDTLTLVSAAKDGIIVRLTTALLPALQSFADRMLAAASNTDKQNTKLAFLSTAFDALARGVLLVADNMKLLVQVGAVFIGAQIASAAVSMGLAFAKMAYAVYTTGVAMTLFNGIRAMSMKGILVMAGLVALAAGAFDGFSEKIKSIGASVANMLPEGGGAKEFIAMAGALGINISALTTDLEKFKGAEMDSAAAAFVASKGLKDFNYGAMAGKNAIDQYLDSQNKSLAAQRAEFDTTGMAAGAKERLKVVLQGLTVAQNGQLAMTDKQRIALSQTANEAELLALKLGNVALLGAANPFLALGVAIDATNAKLASGSLSTQDYNTLVQQSAALTTKLWSDSATSLSGSFDSIGQSLSQLGNGWGRIAAVGKAIGATIAFINSYVAASQALATAVFPANIAIAAGVLANGLAMVASIKSAAVPKMAMGGAFQVPGGIGGGDKVPFNAMLEPGELVEVSSNRPGGYRSGSQGNSSSGGTYTLQVPDFLRPFAEALMPHIEAANRDGHQLKLVTV